MIELIYIDVRCKLSGKKIILKSMALLSDIELTYTEVRCKSANQAWLAYEEKIGNITCFLDLNSSFLNQFLGISVKKSS